MQLKNNKNGGMLMFKLEEKIWLTKERAKGVVKEIEGDNYKVTFFKDEKRETKWFEENDIVKFIEPLKIQIKYFDPNMPKIEKVKTGDWIDLRAAEDITLKQFEFKLIPLGVAMKLPRNYEANIVPRSSTYKNFGIIQTNSFGVVDRVYCGNSDEWFMPVIALRDTEIKKYDRICQMRINSVMPKVVFNEVEKLSSTNRGGHGSSGVK